MIFELLDLGLKEDVSLLKISDLEVLPLVDLNDINKLSKFLKDALSIFL